MCEWEKWRSIKRLLATTVLHKHGFLDIINLRAFWVFLKCFQPFHTWWNFYLGFFLCHYRSRHVGFHHVWFVFSFQKQPQEWQSQNILTSSPWGPFSPVLPGIPGFPWKHIWCEETFYYFLFMYLLYLFIFFTKMFFTQSNVKWLFLKEKPMQSLKHLKGNSYSSLTLFLAITT